MQTLSNRRTKRNTAFAALLVRMFALASRPMRTLGEHPGSELTAVFVMRRTTLAIHYAVHEAAKKMLKAGMTDPLPLPQLRSWNF